MLPEEERFLADLHSAYYNKLLRYASSELKERPMAQDVVQDTFHEAIIKIKTLYTHENPAGWLKSTLKYKINNYNRSHRHYVSRFFSLESELPAGCALPDDAMGKVESSGQPTVWARVKEALRPEELQFLRRYVFDRASHKELAEEFGITVWYSQKKLERLRKKLKAISSDW